MRFHVTHALVASFALASLAGVAHAEGPVDPGQAMYQRYCGACHGPSGKGDGIASSTMRPPPPDLTQIAARNEGKFPTTRVMNTIEGTDSVRAHGDSAMPVWGEIFREQAIPDMTRRIEVRGKVLQIVSYLETIQAK